VKLVKIKSAVERADEFAADPVGYWENLHRESAQAAIVEARRRKRSWIGQLFGRVS
jgi:hypothetical protein